jgi:hypothetical protein
MEALMKLRSWLSCTLVALVTSLAFTGAARASTPVLEVTDFFVGGGPQMASFNFVIDTPGPYTASLFDLGFPSSFANLQLGIAKTGGASQGSISAPGSFSFMASALGSYTALVFGIPTGGASSYSVNVSLVPEPETWAMMIAGLGLIGFKLWRRLKARDMGMALGA